ncbi:putative basic proline-rich protein-like [Iris pallida]|uniref:Basic proline-rich protein-like n=1 Tax=Iris pallida TaxID=29817 RepID=A0AAX6H772_IRIPA|nr:putative basic proline-rich protein-like [Iris pallida]
MISKWILEIYIYNIWIVGDDRIGQWAPTKCKRNRLRSDVEALAWLTIGPYLRLVHIYFILLFIYLYLIYRKFKN